MNALAQAAAVRRAAGLFSGVERGVISVEGSDRTRWLNGMISNDVAALTSGPAASGCYAALLTREGRIVADFQVLLRGDAFWLDVAAGFVGPAVARLAKHIIADDVRLEDRSADFDRLGLEGPAAPEIVSLAVENAPRLFPDACCDVEVAGVPVTLAAFGWSGETAFQLFAPAGSGAAVAERLREAGAARGLVEAGGKALEILRIEAGVPRLGAELDESVLPAEARLERAVSTTKGCYTGQEVVERQRSQGRVSHLLVGLVSAGELPLAVGADVRADARRIGEVTSACHSPAAGSIALAFVRRSHAQPGTELEVEGRVVRVAELPFCSFGSSA